MAATAVQEIKGAYEADAVHSVFGFSVVHNGISTYRGTLDDVSATLTADENGDLALEGAAKVESISIRDPEQFRGHVLGAEFFDAENSPEVTFRSNSVELDEGRATVTGELTIAGKTEEVTATGSYQEPIADPLGNDRVAIELETTFDRRDFGFDWQMELPGGGDVLAWDVTLNIHLELTQARGEDA
jgi:polyisoprenoid-binding protein YceI